MKKFYDERQVREVLETLGSNEYSPLWRVVEDMTYNGHTIEVQASNQFNHVIIDGCYYRIAPNNGKVMCCRSGGESYTPIDFVMKVVLAEPRTEDRDARVMIDAGYERDKSFERLEDAEEYAWREYQSKDNRVSIVREFVDNGQYVGFMHTVWI